MHKRFQWICLGLGVVVLLVVLLIFWSSAGAPDPDRVARTLLTTLHVQPPAPGSIGFWTVSPAADMPDYELSVGKLGSGQAVAMFQKRSDWYGFHQEHTYALLPSETNPAVWQLSETHYFRVLNNRVWNRTSVLTTITNTP